MALVVKENVAPDPVRVGFFGSDGVAFQADAVSNLVQQLDRGIRTHNQNVLVFRNGLY